MSTALLERAFAQAAQLPEDKQNTIAALVLELAIKDERATSNDATKRRVILARLRGRGKGSGQTVDEFVAQRSAEEREQMQREDSRRVSR